MPNPRAQKNANLRSTATGVYDAVTQGLLPMIGNAARGSVAATLGAPGDILGLLSDKQPLPTSQNILDYIPPVGSDKALTGMAETMGGFVPAPGSAGLVRAAKTVANPMTYGRAFMEAQAPAVMSPITAWHGSPHKFRKFDNSKMGTGEGAQAYGAGAYLADAKGVAQGYKEALTSRQKDRLSVDGKPVDPDSMLGRSIEDFSRFGLQAALQKIDDNIKFNDKYAPEIAAMYRGVREKIAGLDPSRVAVKEGYLYKADIPDEAVANMLLWDKPLSEQPEAVRKALTTPDDNGYSLISNLQGDPSFKGFTGGDIYNALTRSSPSQMDVSKRLSTAGIPGIRYLDAGSRGQGAGTMNTVVFDDSIIKILERNGVPLGLLAD